MLPLGVDLGALPHGRLDDLLPVFWQRGLGARLEQARVLGAVNTDDETHPLGQQVQGAALVAALERHGVAHAIVHHVPLRVDHAGGSKSQLVGGYPKRPKPGLFCLESHGRDLLCRATRAQGVGLMKPLPELFTEVLLIMELPDLEERALDPADEIFDAALLVGTVGPTEFHPQAELKDNLGKLAVPLGHDAVVGPTNGDGLGAVENGEHGQTTPTGEVLDQGAD